MPVGPLSRRGPIRVQPFFGFRNSGRLYLNARAIRSREPVFEKRSFWRDFATMVGQYLSKEVPGLPVELEYRLPDGRVLRQKSQTGPEGYVRFDLALSPQCPQPDRTRWERAIVRWHTREGGDGEAAAYILTPGTQTQNGVISDIDDTILETGITGNLRAIARNWKRVMAQMPSERILVPGASAFYAAIGGNPAGSREPGAAIDALTPEARVRPVFYVSSSPWNLFSYLVTFKRERGLPLGPVLLRDWGFNRRTLGKEGHGSHKREAIERILVTFPHLRFALIGDDTQKDLIAFAGIAAAFPGRIAAVFIRSVTGQPLSDEALHAREMIGKAGVPFWSGSDYRAAESFLASAGLDCAGGVERLVRTTSQGARD
ncbi:phosphatase domain-containing protein [Qipengyuania sp. ASV99]|uniref:phosphatase domain-containing protein n=1 Tax=Qipengyuania sp. ASV99 TaxID=3399681 RepID=UPI003A4C64E9